jgi:hypothetical protein
MVVICGQNNYKLNTKHVIDGVVVKGTREGEVEGSITNNRVAHEFCAKNTATCDFDGDSVGRVGWVGWGPPNKNIFFTIFKICFIFPGNDLHWRFYYADRQWKSIFIDGLQLPACKNDDFYWPLALAVTINITKNRFTTATIELLCTSGLRSSSSSQVSSHLWRLLLRVTDKDSTMYNQ